MTLGTYQYRYAVARRWPVVLERYSVRVEVLAEVLTRTTLYYRVRLMGYHADGRGPGTVMRVKASSVKLDRPGPAISVRLPYADD